MHGHQMQLGRGISDTDRVIFKMPLYRRCRMKKMLLFVVASFLLINAELIVYFVKMYNIIVEIVNYLG